MNRRDRQNSTRAPQVWTPHPSPNRPSTLPATVVTGRLVLGQLTEGVSMSNTIQTTIAPAESARRIALEQAEHSGEMEGLHITPATRADGEEYAAGRIDIDEFGARVRSRYGLG